MPSHPTPQPTIATHAVLAGLTPLIPIPFLDDLIYTYLMRSLVRKLAGTHKYQLSEGDVRILASQPTGCGLGCVVPVLIYPFKKVLRKILYFLEWKRATDIISRTYCEGYLLDEALGEGWLETHGSTQVRTAINVVLARTNTSPIKGAVYGVVKQSKGTMKGLTNTLQSFFSKGKRNTPETEVAKAVNEVENESTMENFIEQIQRAIGNLPAEFLQNLKTELGKELNNKNHQ
jgi:hypothetical protein